MTATAAGHGNAAPRGQSPLAATTGGRFGRMFPGLPSADPGKPALDVLAAYLESQKGRGDENGRFPAGYTYLAQFIDHDITFDPTSNILRRNDPLALVNFRTPRFDLDSLYGGGPADQPSLYDWDDRSSDPGVKLLVDCNDDEQGDRAALDLPRNRQGRALIGDARNDEHAIIGQLHLLFIRLHNKVVDHVRDEHRAISSNAVFEEAQRIVRWHYQWIVINDFMPKVVGRPVADAARPSRAAMPGDAAIPVEFSGAAFRFGHSAVRNQYPTKGEHGGVPILLAHGESGLHLGGFRPLKRSLEVNWSLFFWTVGAAPAHAVRAMLMDPFLAAPLFALPPDGASLARLNLHRGRALGLPSGKDVARAIEPDKILTDEQLLPVEPPPDASALVAWHALLDAPPLWYYILCEARTHGRPLLADGTLGRGGAHLGPVGGRIVAEVLVGLLERDPASYLHHPSEWKPHLRAAASTGDAARPYSMTDLVEYVEAPAER